jgi:hypothetical protein
MSMMTVNYKHHPTDMHSKTGPGSWAPGGLISLGTTYPPRVQGHISNLEEGMPTHIHKDKLTAASSGEPTYIHQITSNSIGFACKFPVFSGSLRLSKKQCSCSMDILRLFLHITK